jgi:16S rRNA (guanine966-N2)-methyltransferase
MPPRRPSTGGSSRGSVDPSQAPPTPPRIIGGRLRGKKLFYDGDDRTRPMKDRVREAVFNLLGPGVVGKHALDLFAGTGALGFEALSRGAAAATFVERHFPTADHIRQTAASLGVADCARVEAANAFIWIQRDSPPKDTPWVAFVSPPWALFSEQPAEMLALITRLIEICPPESMVVIEADESFDYQTLPQADHWDVRTYRPAVVGLLRLA